MSLRLKFTIILALLVTTLVLNVVLSVWSIRFLEQELAWPLRSAQPVLSSLHQIKRFGEQELAELGVGRVDPEFNQDRPSHASTPEERGRHILEIEELASSELDKLKQTPTVAMRSGVSTTDNLRARSNEIKALMHAWITLDSTSDQSAQTSAAFDQLVNHIELRHELIERIEGRILQDAKLATNYGARLNLVVFSIIGVSVTGALASLAYAIVLLRRWILEPIKQLREGARLLGQGEFEHQIVINTGDELGQLGEEFNTMSSLILAMQDQRIEQERMAAMGEMAQRTVHNLRTPLAGIRALAETTKDELAPDSDLHQFQNRILDTVDRFETWLQGMLRVSAPLSIEHIPYVPSELIANVVRAHQDAADAQQITIRVENSGTPDRAIGDPHHLEHALTALLSNAIEFSAQSSSIEIALNSAQNGRYWTARITDQGPGIDPDLHLSIFRPYFTTRKSGTGIGLAMVKRIIDQHQGTVTVQSPIDPDSASGTAFMISVLVDTSTDQ